MAFNAKESQLVGDICKNCRTNEHVWVNGRLVSFLCKNTKSCAPKSPEELAQKAGTNKKCPLIKIIT